MTAFHSTLAYTSTLPRLALVIDWLTNFGGAERVLLALHQLFPQAPIFTTIHNAAAVPAFAHAQVHTSFLQRWPQAKTKWQRLLPLLPAAIESLDLSAFDLVVSVSSCVAKGVITKPHTLHLCYCNSPMRYAWDDYHTYTRSSSKFGRLSKLFIPFLMKGVREWDYLSTLRVDHFLANSHFIAQRVQKYYRRTAEVLYPPVATDQFSPSSQPRDYFLILSRLVPNKRVDLAIQAFNQLGLPLKIAGDGSEEKKLRRLAGANITFLGQVTETEKANLLANCQALLYPQEEDFGITAVEAFASGRPVIAYQSGGAAETVIPGETGLFFPEQTAPALIAAVQRFHADDFVPQKLVAYAQRFATSHFQQHFLALLQQYWQEWQEKGVASASAST